MLTNRNRVVIQFDERGDFKIQTDQTCDVLVVDERVPDDRVYQFTKSGSVAIGREAVDAVLADSRIGHADDGFVP